MAMADVEAANGLERSRSAHHPLRHSRGLSGMDQQNCDVTTEACSPEARESWLINDINVNKRNHPHSWP